ncbi:MAG: PQQ-like beta-propeller repeat protein [bacterium]|nr:PQQ-like beta-propeller repeat protein [bacterium]
MRSFAVLGALSSWVAGAPAVGAQEPIVDPAPPAVNELSPVAAPTARDFDELRTFGAARPLPAGAQVENWPGFLGPRRDGRSRETGLLTKWPEGRLPPLWTMQRGSGFASPVVFGDRLVYPHRVGKEILIECLEATTGKRFWQFRYPTDYRAEYFDANGPCSTPIVDGERVWVHGVEGWLHCLELATGRVVWKRDLKTEFGLEQQFFGVTASPLMWRNQLIINLGVPKGPTVAAFDKSTGRLLWGTGTRWGMSCASPVLATLHGEERVLVLAGGQIAATGRRTDGDRSRGAADRRDLPVSQPPL